MPTKREVHIDAPLSNVLIAAFETMGDFVAQQLFPVVSVGKQSDKYYVLKKEEWLKRPNARRARKTEAKRIEFSVSSDSYYADNYALAGENALEDLDNADSAIALRDSTAAVIARALQADMEERVVGVVQTNVSTIARMAAGDAWDAITSADIQTQVHNAHISIFQNTGLRANTLMLDYQTYLYARRNQALFQKFQYRATGTALISDAQLMEAFNVDRILIARSQKNNANTSQAASLTSIWGPTALLARIDPSAASLKTMTYGLGFRWTPSHFPAPMAITTDIIDGAGSKKVEVMEGEYFQAEKVVASDLAYYINTKSGVAW